MGQSKRWYIFIWEQRSNQRSCIFRKEEAAQCKAFYCFWVHSVVLCSEKNETSLLVAVMWPLGFKSVTFRCYSVLLLVEVKELRPASCRVDSQGNVLMSLDLQQVLQFVATGALKRAEMEEGSVWWWMCITWNLLIYSIYI